MAKQKTIGTSPLAEYLGATSPASDILPENTHELQEITKSEKKQRVTIYVSNDLIERVRDAVYWEPSFTLAEFAELAFTQALKDLEQKKGQPYPSRKTHRLKSGRPIR